jgi:hypothetical protein
VWVGGLLGVWALIVAQMSGGSLLSCLVALVPGYCHVECLVPIPGGIGKKEEE